MAAAAGSRTTWSTHKVVSLVKRAISCGIGPLSLLFAMSLRTDALRAAPKEVAVRSEMQTGVQRAHAKDVCE